MATTKQEPAVGQVWRDRDKRMSSGKRHVRIESIADGRAQCRRVFPSPGGGWMDEPHGGQTTVTRVSLKNFGPRWEFVS